MQSNWSIAVTVVRHGTFSFQSEHSSQEDKITISEIRLPVLKGDVKVMFFSTNQVTIQLYRAFHVNWIRLLQRVPRNYDDCAFYFWFNTSFVENNSYVSSIMPLFQAWWTLSLLCSFLDFCSLAKNWIIHTRPKLGTSFARNSLSYYNSRMPTNLSILFIPLLSFFSVDCAFQCRYDSSWLWCNEIRMIQIFFDLFMRQRLFIPFTCLIQTVIAISLGSVCTIKDF